MALVDQAGLESLARQVGTAGEVCADTQSLHRFMS